MEKFYHIYDFYIKGLDPNSIRHIMGEMNDLKNSFHDDIILKPEKFVKNHDFSSKQYKRLYDIVYWEYENINRYLLKHQRKPFFDTNNLNECIKKRDEYLDFLKESECMEKYGITNFSNYIPEIFENDLTTALDIYIEDKFIKTALQHQNPPHINITAGLSHHNPYKFVNWMLQYYGYMPIFEDVMDEEKCNIKREELLKLRSKQECLKYWGLENEEELIKYKTKRYVFKLEKYINCFGTDVSNIPWRYHLGRNLYTILDSNASNEEKLNAIRLVNRINEKIIFEDPNDIDKCIDFLKKHLEIVLK